MSHAGRRELHWKWFKKNDVEWFQVFLYLPPPPPTLQPGAASCLPTPRHQLQNSSYEDPSKGLPLLTAAPRECWNDLSLKNNTFSSQHIFQRCNYIFLCILKPRNASLDSDSISVKKSALALTSETDSFISPMTTYSCHIRKYDVNLDYCCEKSSIAKMGWVHSIWLGRNHYNHNGVLFVLELQVFEGNSATTHPLFTTHTLTHHWRAAYYARMF